MGLVISMLCPSSVADFSNRSDVSECFLIAIETRSNSCAEVVVKELALPEHYFYMQP